MTNLISIALVSGMLRITAQLPDAGEYWLMQSQDARQLRCTVLASVRATNACTLTVTRKPSQSSEVFWLERK